MLGVVAQVLVAVALLYVLLTLVIALRQSAYVYVPDRHVDLTPAAFNVTYEDVRLRSGNGETIAGWFIPAFDADGDEAPTHELAGATVLMCHGNAGDIADRLGTILVFHKWRLNVCIFDYQGYGNSTGRPSEAGTYQDAMAAWTYLTAARGMSPDRIFLYGRSLGGAVAAWLAEAVAPPVLVLESTFTSAPDMAAVMFPFLPTRLIGRFKYDTLGRIGGLRCPLLIAHSPQDRMVPFTQGRRLFDAARKPKQFVQLVDGHNDGGLDTNPAYQRALKDFLVAHLAHRGPA